MSWSTSISSLPSRLQQFASRFQQSSILPSAICIPLSAVFHSAFSKAVPSRTTTLARALMPRQPYSAAVKSDRRSGYIPCPLRGKGLGESGGALFKGKEGRGDFRKTSFERRPVQSDTAMRSKNNFFKNRYV